MACQVLQRDSRGFASVNVKGKTDRRIASNVFVEIRHGRRLLVEFGKKSVGRCIDGGWEARLSGLPAGGPYEFKFRAGKEFVSVANILVGDVWVLAGQSNMVGDGEVKAALQPHPMVHAFYSWDEWRRAVEPVHFPAGSVDPSHNERPILDRAEILREHKIAVKGAGLGLAFGRSMFRRTGVPQGVIPCAVGGTSMAQWSPKLKKNKGRSLYGAMLRRFRLMGQPVAGVLWYQGEADTSGDTVTYTDSMCELVKSVRKDFKNPSLPWIMVQLGKTHLFSEEESEQVSFLSIREQQRLLPGEIKNLLVVPAIDLPMEDGIHIATEGQNILGERLARAAAYSLKVNGAKKTIELKSIRLVPCPTNWGQCPAIEIMFANVAGDLQSNGVPAGFRLIRPDGKILKRIHKVLFKGGGRLLVVPYTYPDFSMEGYRISYGYDLDAYCNIHDSENMSLPAFAPQQICGGSIKK